MADIEQKKHDVWITMAMTTSKKKRREEKDMRQSFKH